MADLKGATQVRQGQIKYTTHCFSGFGKWQAMLPEEPGQIYCTNEKGEGLFIQRLDTGAVRQIEGLGQFTPTNFDHFKRMIRRMRNEKRANAEITPSERLEKLGSVLGRMLRAES